MTLKKMPIYVEPMRDESFIGYLGRVADRNFLPSTRQLFELLELPGQGLIRKTQHARENAEIIASTLSLPPSRLDQMLLSNIDGDDDAFSINGLELTELQFCRPYRRVSPTSLAASPHHRLNWQLFDLPYCPESWELLTEHCLAFECRSALGWRMSGGVHICEHCGYDLRRGSTPSIEPEHRDTLRFLADIVSLDELENQRALLQLHPLLRNLNRGTLLQLVHIFGRAEAATRGHTNTRKRRIMVNYPDLQITGAEILRAYPQSLIDMADRQFAPGTPRLFGFLRYTLDGGVTKDTAHFVQQMIRDLQPNSHSSLRSLSSVRLNQGMLTLRDVARKLKVDNSAVARLREIGELSPQRVRGDERKIDWYDNKDVSDLVERMQDRISPEQIHSLYRLPATAIEQFVHSELLRWHPSPAVQATYRGAFLVGSEFEAFRERLEGMVIHKGYPKATRVKLSDCFALVGPNVKPWGPIISMAVNGQLPGGLGMIDPRRGLRASNLTVDFGLAVQIQQGNPPWTPLDEPDRHYCSQFEAEERLDCFPIDVADLIRSGHLRRILPNNPRLSRESVLAASQTLISSREIAARLGIETLAALNWIRRRNLTHPSPDTRLYLRSHLTPLLPPILYGNTKTKGAKQAVPNAQPTDDTEGLATAA